mmetsp:Transcript_96706/g.167851  ORF Transcript_96706/g.167851 Transcript_96706/m.167851 type:complete len:217 (+) Transcript_96706:65-715(+)
MTASPIIVFLITFCAAPALGQKLRGSPPSTGCKGSFCDGVPDDKFAILLERGVTSVLIGDSTGNNSKCVDVAVPVTCAKDAGDLGKRLNDDDHTDTYEITVNNSGKTVCARRSDKNEGWGQILNIPCKEVHDSSQKCLCLTSPEGDCRCKGCSESEQQRTCLELLGPCECMRSEEAICDCHGYCHTKENRQQACESEPGCQWSGMWCEAQLGLLWD